MSDQELVHKLLNHIYYGRLNIKLMKPSLSKSSKRARVIDYSTPRKGSDENGMPEQRPSRTNAERLGNKIIKGKLVTNSGYPINTVEIEKGMLVVTDASEKSKRKFIERTVIKTQYEEYPVAIRESLIYLICDRDIVKDCEFDTATHSMNLSEFVKRFYKFRNQAISFEFTPLRRPKRIEFHESYITR